MTLYAGHEMCIPVSVPNPSVLEVARKRIALRGPAGFFALSRRLFSAGYFRSWGLSNSPSGAAVTASDGGATNASDSDGDNGPLLSLGGFKDALSDMGCGLSGMDLTNVFMHLDDRNRGEVQYSYA